MADGNTSNGTANTASQGDQSMVVAQVRTPSTPFNSDMNPLSDFHFSDREEVVTVKDVEEIVSAVKDSFSKFIETQRSYLDRMNTQTSTSSQSSTTSDTKPENSTESPKKEDDYNKIDDSNSGLTEATISDIIQEFSEEINSSKNEILENISDLKTSIQTKEDSIQNVISEKLIESNENEDKDDSIEKEQSLDKNSSNDSTMSFVEFMSSSFSNIKDSISNVFSSLFEDADNKFDSIKSEISNTDEEAGSSISLPSTFTDIENVKIDEFDENKKSEPIEENDFSSNEFESYGRELTSRLDDFFLNFNEDSENSTVDVESSNEISTSTSDNGYFEEFKANQVSMTDVVNETNEFVKSLVLDIDNIATSISGLENGGLAKSIVDMMVQDSSIELMISGTFDEISTSLVENIDSRFGEVIDFLKRIEESSNVPHGTMNDRLVEKENEDDSSNGNVETVAETVAVESLVEKVNIAGQSKDSENRTLDSVQNKYNQTSSSAEQTTNNSLFGFITDSIKKIASLFSTDKKDKSSEQNTDENVSENLTVSPIVESGTDVDSIPRITVESENGENKDEPYSSILNTANSELTQNSVTQDSVTSFNEYFDNMISYFDDMIDSFKKSIEDMVGENNIQSNGIGEIPSVVENLDVQETVSPMVSETKDETKTAQTTNSTTISEKGSNDDSEKLTEIQKAVDRNKEYNGERFDKIEQMLNGVSVNGGNGGGEGFSTAFVPEMTDNFEVERIH